MKFLFKIAALSMLIAFGARAGIAQAPLVRVTSSEIPDVRGLQYRAVTLAQFAPASVSGLQNFRRDYQPPAVHLWILPAKNGDRTALGLGWNGVEYELKSVGALADWRADVNAYIKPRVEGAPNYRPRAFEFSGAPVSQLFLERLGAPELRRPARLGRSSYGSADPNAEYLQNLRNAGVSFFTQGDFEQAKRQLQTLLAILPVETGRGVYNSREEARAILADITRREADALRPVDEVAGLIWDLQNVRSINGWSIDPTLRKLVDAGDRAVESLLDALENDARLTLAVRTNNFKYQRFEPIATVRDAAQEALNVLLKHRYYATNPGVLPDLQQKRIAEMMRADWDKVKGQTPVERVFQALAQPNQSPDRLEEAARELVRIGKPYYSNIQYVEKKNGVYQSILEPKTFFGEPLRARQSPSVSDLLEARVLELSQRALIGKPTPNALDPTLPYGPDTPDSFALNKAMNAANALSLVETKWDLKRAAPLLGAQLERAKRFARLAPRGLRESAENDVNRARIEFLEARLNTPFRAAAMREYAAWVQSQPFGRFSQDNYAPLWRFPSEPVLQGAFKTLLNTPRKPFQAAAQFTTGGFDYDSAFRLLASPLLETPLFRAAISRELDNKTVIGTLIARKNGEAEVKVTAWSWSGQHIYTKTPHLENGVIQPLRVCDLVGFWLMENRPMPSGQTRTYPLLDVSLPTAKRDVRLRQIKVMLVQNRVWIDSDRFSG